MRAAGEHERAIADYDQLLKLDPQLAEAYDQRGSQRVHGRTDQAIDR